jgi:outer membrane protein assembly factor BamD (BamD/ComL family)
VSKKLLTEKLSSSLKNFGRCLFLALVMGIFVACGEDPQQLFETAQFEEQQHNQVHAKELYEHILRDYPAGPVARKAEERLKELKKENP